MSVDTLIKIVMNVALLFVMFSMGLALTLKDFRRVAAMPGPVARGVVGQMLVLPLIGLMIVFSGNLPTFVALGLMLIAVCPGGPISNFFSHVSGGDSALSVTLTTVTTLMSIVTLPLIFEWTPMGEYADASKVPALHVLKSLVIGVLLPISAGMIARRMMPNRADRISPHLGRIGLGLIFVVLGLLMYKNRALYADVTGPLVFSAVSLNVLAMLAGYYLGAVPGGDLRRGITLSYEVGLQNVPLATVIGYSLFTGHDTAESAMTIVLAVVGLYAVSSIATGLLAVAVFKGLKRRQGGSLSLERGGI